MSHLTITETQVVLMDQGDIMIAVLVRAMADRPRTRILTALGLELILEPPGGTGNSFPDLSALSPSSLIPADCIIAGIFFCLFCRESLF